MRITVRTRPGSSRTVVGGGYGDASDGGLPALVVRVCEPAVGGAANEGVVRAVAAAFGVRPREVRIITGHRGRTKVVEVDIPDAAGEGILRALLGLS